MKEKALKAKQKASLKCKSRAIKMLISAAVTSCAVLACVQTMSGLGVQGTTVDVGELSAGDISAIESLYVHIGGAGATDYASLKSALGGASKSAQELGATEVKLGGYSWWLAYVSEDINGDVTATLLLKNGTSVTSYANNWYAPNALYKYPGDMYSTSLVRSRLVGSSYASSANTETLTAGSASSEWTEFIGKYGDYIGLPIQSVWQREQWVSYESSGSFALPNEATTPNEGVGYAAAERNYENREEYFNWVTDKLWLPSLSELGTTARSGIWELSEVELSQAQGYHTRSGDSLSASYTYRITADGSAREYKRTDEGSLVRPAFHLNLRAVSQVIECKANVPEVTPEAQGFSGVNDGLEYSGGYQTALKYNAEQITYSGGRLERSDGSIETYVAGDGNSNIDISPAGELRVKSAGKYRIDFRLSEGVTEWSDGSSGIKSIEFEVRRKSLKVKITASSGSEQSGGKTLWSYDGAEKWLSAELESVPEGVSERLTVSYRGESGVWSETRPINAGEYTARIRMEQEHSDYTVSAESKMKIEALSVSVNWTTDGYKITETNGIHKIYDGNEHMLEGELNGALSAELANGEVYIRYAYARGASAEPETAESGLKPRNAGEYTVFGYLDGVKSGNYYIENASGEKSVYAEISYKITPREVRLEWEKNAATSSYKWEYSGYANRTEMEYQAETSENSQSGESGIVTGESLNIKLSYAEYSAGILGEYVTSVRVNAGLYRVRASQGDGNYKLTNSEQDYEITRRKVRVDWSGNGSYGQDGEIMLWRYDGREHSPEATATVSSGTDGVSGGANLTVYLEVTGAESEVTQLSTSKDKGYYESEVSFKAGSEEYTKNYELENTLKKYRIDKGRITGVSWYKPKQEAGREEITTPESYIWGEITGENGPGYIGEATAEVYNVEGDLETVTFNMSVSYPGANYPADEKWPVNDKTGYKVLGTLSGDSISGPAEYSGRFEFGLPDGSGSVTTEWQFYILPKAGQKEEITVTWVIFTDSERYYTLEEISGMSAGLTPSGGGNVKAEDGRYGFVYNGKTQSPTAIYRYAQADEDGREYEILPQSTQGQGRDAGEYTTYLLPHNKYAYAHGSDECVYEITPLTIKLEWGELEWQYSGKYRAPEVRLDSEYISSGAQWYKEIITELQTSGGELSAITASGATDAGEYESECGLGANYAYADDSGKAKIKIGKFKISVTSVEWEYPGASNDSMGADPEAWYWTYDGKEHTPEASLKVSADGENTAELKLRVVGGAKEVGEHYAYAWLDGADAQNRNYILIESESNPVSAQAVTKFRIKRLKIEKLYWQGREAVADWQGATIELNGKIYELSENGTEVLENEYTGGEWRPRAYIYVNGGYVELSAEGGETNVGSYVAWITDDYEFEDGAGNALSTECGYRITPYKLEITWQSVDALIEFEYTGLEQKPEVKVETGVKGERVSYEQSGGTNAGLYKSEIRITDVNYTYKGTVGIANVKEFRITPKQLDIEWSWSEDGVQTNAEGTEERAYNGKAAGMEVSGINGVSGQTVELPGYGVITIEFGYGGRSSQTGAHRALARIAAVKINGQSESISNFAITEATAYKEYKITAYAITASWQKNAETQGYTWVYDGKEHAPEASYELWDGSEIQAEVTGARTDAGKYTASIALPEELRKNCVFASYEADGKEFTCGEQSFEILKARIQVQWTFDEAEYIEALGEWQLTYDGKEHAPKAYEYSAEAADNLGAELSVTGGAADAGKRYAASAQLKDTANYEFASTEDGLQYFTIKVRTVWVAWEAEENAETQGYTWVYDGKEHAPKAYLTADEDGGEFVIDGKKVYTIVSGGAVHAGKYTARAEIVSSNYAFPDGAEFKQDYEIVAMELSDEEFWWTDSDKLVNGVYEYEYNGQSQHPVAETRNFTEFGYKYELTNADFSENNGAVSGITDAGWYKVTVEIVNNNDYKLAEGAGTVYVRITPKSVTVIWGADKLVYNGENQTPEAYFKDANGVKIALEVSVTESEHKNAGTKYHATADFINAESVTNYTLKAESAECEFEISKRSIRIEWGAHSFDYDNLGHRVEAKVYINDALSADIADLGIEYVILNKDGEELKDANGDYITEVIRAGEYKALLRITGSESIKINYELADTDDGDGEQLFTVNRRKLVVTADAAEVKYGEKAPAFTATYGETHKVDGVDVVFYGLIGQTEEEAGLVKDGIRAWLVTEYVPGSVPVDGGYEIKIDAAMLGALLPDYEIEAHSGTLTVLATPNTVIWYGDRLVGDPNFEYNGKEQKPAAYLYKQPDKLKVVYVDDEGNELTDFAAVNAGTYRVKAIVPDGVSAENSQFTEYTIFPREITVDISAYETVYGDKELTAGDGSDILTEAEIKTLWSFNPAKLPVNGDDLGIYFTWDVKEHIVNGYLQSGVYYLEGHYNENPNYRVIFEGTAGEDAPDKAHLGEYIVKNADITDESKQGTEWFYEESVIEKYEQYFIRIEDKITDAETGEESYEYVKYAGDQTAEVKFSYSKPYLAGKDEIPAPDENESYPNTDKNNTGISDKGIWVINYRIEIPNHNTYYGRWTVLIKYADEYVIIIFVKAYEIEYGEDLPENLTETLVDGGYVEISGAITDKEEFKKIAEAYVPLGYDKFVSNRTKVGKYNPCFKLNVSEDSTLNVIYRKNNRDEDSNLGKYVIKPRRLTVAWGATEFTYDGNKHFPMPVIGHWIGEGSFVLENIANGKVYAVTDGGGSVNVTVYTEGNFVSSGGHRVIISVDDPNYVISTADAVQTISIKGAFPWWLVYTVGALALAAMIAFVIMAVIMRKRKMIILAGISDDEGFYDSFVDDDDPSGLNDPYYGPLYSGDPTGLSDGYYAKDYNDGFDYEQMWADINSNPPDNLH